MESENYNSLMKRHLSSLKVGFLSIIVGIILVITSIYLFLDNSPIYGLLVFIIGMFFIHIVIYTVIAYKIRYHKYLYKLSYRDLKHPYRIYYSRHTVF